MNSKDIWVVYTVSKVLEGCGAAMDGSEYLSADCFIPADNIQVAISQVEEFLLEKRCRLIDISKCLRYEPQDWQDDSEESALTKKFAEKARQSDQPKYAVFRGIKAEDISAVI